MNLKLLKSAVIETDGTRSVEMVFTDGPEPELAQEVLTFRVPVDAKGYPRIPAGRVVISARKILIRSRTFPMTRRETRGSRETFLTKKEY